MCAHIQLYHYNAGRSHHRMTELKKYCKVVFFLLSEALEYIESDTIWRVSVDTYQLIVLFCSVFLTP